MFYSALLPAGQLGRAELELARRAFFCCSSLWGHKLFVQVAAICYYACACHSESQQSAQSFACIQCQSIYCCGGGVEKMPIIPCRVEVMEDQPGFTLCRAWHQDEARAGRASEEGAGRNGVARIGLQVSNTCTPQNLVSHNFAPSSLSFATW